MINTQNNFPESWYRHCHNVGLKMYSYAKYVLRKEESYCRDMFLLGCFHDIGYMFDANVSKHGEAMSEVISANGYKYANEIRYHSHLQDTHISNEMKLLYFGDMTVDGMGNWCTFDERIKDIGYRHGVESEAYKEAEKIATQLRVWGFNDTLTEQYYVAHIS